MVKWWRHIPVVLGIFMMLVVACGGAGADTPPPTNLTPTNPPPAVPGPTGTATPTALPTGPPANATSQSTAEPSRPTEVPETTPAPARATEPPHESRVPIIFDPEEVAARALSSPELMACLTEEETKLLNPCVEADAALTGASGGTSGEPTKILWTPVAATAEYNGTSVESPRQ